MSNPSKRPRPSGPPTSESSDPSSSPQYSPNVTWGSDNYEAFAQSQNNALSSSNNKRAGENRQSGATSTSGRRAPTSAPAAAAASASSFSSSPPPPAAAAADEAGMSNVDTPGNRVWPTRIYRENDVSYIVPGQSNHQFDVVPPGWTVQLGFVSGPHDRQRPTGIDVVEFDVPGQGTFYMDYEDNIFTYAPSNVRILRDGEVQDPIVTPLWPANGGAITFLIEGRDGTTPTFPLGGQLRASRVRWLQDSRDGFLPGPTKTLIPFHVPGTPRSKGTYYVDRDDQVYNFVPVGWHIHDDHQTPLQGPPSIEPRDKRPGGGDQDGRLPAMVPRLTNYGVRFRDPADPSGPDLSSIPPGRIVDVSDRASEDTDPPSNVVGIFWWRDRTYYIDLKHRIYTTRPMDSFVPVFDEEPQPPPPRPPPPVSESPARAIFQRRVRDARIRPRSRDRSSTGASSNRPAVPERPTPLRQAWSARYSPSSSPSSSPSKRPSTNPDPSSTPSRPPPSTVPAPNSNSSSDDSSGLPPFNWHPLTRDMTWRRMGRMIRAARRRLNDLEDRRETFDETRSRSGAQPSSRSVARTRRTFERRRATRQRRREEPEERCRGSQDDDDGDDDDDNDDDNNTPPQPPPPSSGASSSSAPRSTPAARTPARNAPAWSRTTQDSAGSKQSTRSASGNNLPQAVEVVDRDTLALLRPIDKTSTLSSLSSPPPPPQQGPAGPRPGRRPLPTGRPADTAGVRAAEASRPVRASPLRQEVQRGGDNNQQQPRFPDFEVRTTQESRSGVRLNWVAANYPASHADFLNDAIKMLWEQDWFADDHFQACLRFAMQRPLDETSPSSSSTQPRPFKLTFILSEYSAGRVELGAGTDELQAFRDAELRVIPINPRSLASVAGAGEWADVSTSLGYHWSVAMEYRGILYYFDTCERMGGARRDYGSLVFRWYQDLRTAAGVTGRLRLKVVNVSPQNGPRECGILAAELVRKVVQDHNGDPSAVTDWGPQSKDAILQKWVRAMIQDLGDAYRCPVPGAQRRERRAQDFRATAPPPPPSSPSASSSSRGRGLPTSTPILADHTGSYDVLVHSLKRTVEEVDADDGEAQPARKTIRER